MHCSYILNPFHANKGVCCILFGVGVGVRQPTLTTYKISTTRLSMMTFSMTTFSIRSLSRTIKTGLCIKALSIMMLCKRYLVLLCWVAFCLFYCCCVMLNFTIRSVILLSVVPLFRASYKKIIKSVNKLESWLSIYLLCVVFSLQYLHT
jgi:hypothetical protein